MTELSYRGAPGSTVELTAAIAGKQRLRYQWMRNGTNIPAAFSEKLTLNGADAARAGEYKVRVTGLTGEATSAAAEVSLFSMTTNRTLRIEGTVGNTYRIESTDRLNTPTAWTQMTNVVLSAGSVEIPIGSSPSRFYRAALTSP